MAPGRGRPGKGVKGGYDGKHSDFLPFIIAIVTKRSLLQ